MKFSLSSLISRAASGKRWPRQWRPATPAAHYDVVVVGGGGHGLATAFYLASRHDVGRIAVIERGWIGGGNTGRNTTIVRANYMHPGNFPFYARSLELWADLSRVLNYNVMYSPRGMIGVAHTPDAMDAYAERVNVLQLNGMRARLLSRAWMRERLPYLNHASDARFPVVGGMLQEAAGTVRHDAVVWGYARAVSALGVDVCEHVEVDGFVEEAGRIVGLRTSAGTVRAGKVVLATAGSTSVLAARAGIRLPMESHVLQAYVTEGLKPMLEHVVSWAGGHFYISQSDKGGLVFGSDLDGYASYAQRGGLGPGRHAAAAAVSLIPALSRVRLLRQWGGVVDQTMDGSPFIDVARSGLWVTAGWCYGGFKAIPASGLCTAWAVAEETPHPLATGFRLDRFAAGRELDEEGSGPFPHLH